MIQVRRARLLEGARTATGCEIDRFDFALPVHRENGLLVARPTWP